MSRTSLAREPAEAAVAEHETVGIVEDLDIVPIAFGKVERILMLPMVMVLVIAKCAYAAWRDIERGMAEMVIVADSGL